MSYILVSNGEVCGYSDVNYNIPYGYEAVLDVWGIGIDNLFVQNGKVKPKPPRPSDNYVWDVDHWREFQTLPMLRPSNLSDMELFKKAYVLAKTYGDVAVEFAVYLYADAVKDTLLFEEASSNLIAVMSKYTDGGSTSGSGAAIPNPTTTSPIAR